MKSCLIIDDSRVVRKVLCRIVDELGFAPIEVEDGEKAYQHCQNSMPEAIILDWNMPVMSGIEFLEKLRALDEGEKPRVLLCTTEDDVAHIQRAISAGADEYVMKPFDKTIIESKLKRVGALDS